MCELGKETLYGKILTTGKNFENFIVDDSRKILYCYVPKVACTNWKRIMYVLKKGEPYIDPLSVHRNSVHQTKALDYLTDFSPEEREIRLRTYTKFLFVRDPFVRLISAFRQKFQSIDEPFYSNYGKTMVRLYRNQSDPPKTQREVIALGLQPTFYNFVQYLLDPRTERYGPFNEHWRQMHRLCHPCMLEYDFIGHQETLEEDAGELLKMLEVENKIHFPPTKNATTSDFIKEWFKTVPLEDRRMLYNLYKWDFKIFGFKRPDEILDS
ncbi:PREDICTED: carbohydrate sulfotransferase 12-like [Cyprinodon variegatus]|nr:PREDICTED: carbohydrate sulfotransferase 12-like [Cyprinodon variegatus]